MSHASAWSALADCFDIVAVDSAIELSIHPEDATAFDKEMIWSRLLFRYRPDESRSGDRLISIHSKGADSLLTRWRVNRFRWLCWAAGLMLDPYVRNRSPEVAWLLEMASGADVVLDIAPRSAARARHFAEFGRTPSSSPLLVQEQWGTNQQTTFGRYADRFAGAIFQGTRLHLTIGHRDRVFGQPDEDDKREFQTQSEMMRYGGDRRLVLRTNTGGTTWGDMRAVEEFESLAKAAFSQFPTELQIGPQPCLFPSHLFGPHTSFAGYWWDWGVVMWALCPSGFELHYVAESGVPLLKSRGRPEITAATVCQHLANTSDSRQVARDVRTTLATLNPWLNPTERSAAEQAVVAAYQPLTSLPKAPIPDAVGLIVNLSEREEALLIEMLGMRAVGSRGKVRITDVVAKLGRSKDPANYKRDFSRLRKMSLTDSAQGPSGGVWLTALGLATAERLSV